ncbi:MAG TPA: ferrous iron transporter B [Firmicutes bacterium]|nr:ferrous iron transporter B [Bacillota bacterium]
MRILLIGNPNVGKSAVFSRLTGTQVIISNYTGTTVEFTKGSTVLRTGETREVIDVPGTYSLEPTCKAEEVAVSILDSMLDEGDVIVNVVDATHLERNLYLTLQLLERDIPVVVALNLWDEARHKGISIDVDRLENILGVSVVPTSALTGEGIDILMDRISQMTEDADAESRRGQDTSDSLRGFPGMASHPSADERWTEIGRILTEVQSISHRHHTFIDRLEDASIQPVTGLIIAVLVMYLSFKTVGLIGEGLISYVFDPVFEGIVRPVVTQLGVVLGSEGFLHDLLIGRLVNGQIDFETSMGLLTTGLYVPIAMVLPYVFAFYVALGILEDVGYLPRLAVLVDNLMHVLGMHGYAIIPMVLGFGCNVPAALATRILESRREKFICATMLSIGIPCMAQTAMVVGLIGRYGWQYLAIIYGILFILWLIIGFVLNAMLPGSSPPLLMEIPPYRLPHPKVLGKKVWIRIRVFLADAIPYVFLGVLFVNILHVSGIIDALSRVFAPLLGGLLGLPSEAIVALLMGFVRKDVAVGMLSPLGLSVRELVVAVIVLTAYFPCAATFVVLLRELGPLDMLKSALIMLVAAFGAGALTNLVMSRVVSVGRVIIGLIVMVVVILLVSRVLRTIRVSQVVRTVGIKHSQDQPKDQPRSHGQ